jgi:hypothetical protein
MTSRTVAFVLLMLLASAAAAAPSADAPDTSGVRPAAPAGWGPLPAPSDSTTAVFADRPRPAWETVVMVPYWVLGIPFRIIDWAAGTTLVELDELGVFDAPPADYPGLPGPFGSVWLPSVSIESLEGVRLGVDLTRPRFLHDDGVLHMTYYKSSRQAQKLAAGASRPVGEGWELELGGGGEEIPLVRYYGLGWDSRKGDVSYYHRGATWGGFELARRLDRRHTLSLRTYYSRVVAKESRYEVDRSLGTIHGEELPPGYPGRSEGWTARLALQHDSTDEEARPNSGSFVTGAVSWFEGTGSDDLRFLTWHLSAERYVPLWYTGRTLALRGFFNRIGNEGGSGVPFTRLVTFSSPDELRGFQTLRFYGHGSLGASIEYRWPIWNSRNRDGPGLDAYVFSDIGQVFDHTADIALEHLQPAGGFGLRLLGDHGGFLGRVEVGLSDEEPVYRLKFSQTFQHDRKVLLRGRDPTRYR